MNAPPTDNPVERLWRFFDERDWERAGEELHDEFVADWPQTSERFRGRDNFIAMNRAHPASGWSIDLRRTVVAGDVIAAEVAVPHDAGLDFCTGFYELRDGKIARATEYWSERLEQDPPEWRAQWREPGD